MANHTRSHGANARAQDWDDFEDEGAAQHTGSWLPLEALEDELYFPAPDLRAMPTRGQPGRMQPATQHTVREALPESPRRQKRATRTDAGQGGLPARFIT